MSTAEKKLSEKEVEVQEKLQQQQLQYTGELASRLALTIIEDMMNPATVQSFLDEIKAENISSYNVPESKLNPFTCLYTATLASGSLRASYIDVEKYLLPMINEQMEKMEKPDGMSQEIFTSFKNRTIVGTTKAMIHAMDIMATNINAFIVAMDFIAIQKNHKYTPQYIFDNIVSKVSPDKEINDKVKANFKELEEAMMEHVKTVFHDIE